MPARISTPGLTTSRTVAGAISERKRAAETPSGAATADAMSVTITVPWIIGTIEYRMGGETASQFGWMNMRRPGTVTPNTVALSYRITGTDSRKMNTMISPSIRIVDTVIISAMTYAVSS